MKKFLVLFLTPASVIENWKQTDEATRKPAEEKMMAEWQAWMKENAKAFAEMPAGAGKTKRITAQGISDAKNDVMLYGVVQADSHDAAAKIFAKHPHFGIPQASIEVMEINAMHGTK